MAFPVFSKITRSISTAVISAGVLSLCVFSPAALAAESKETLSNALQVVIDRAKVVRIAKSADTVIVGNPSIVDATIQDSRTIVLTGRNFGVTNLIVLDADGDAIVDETVVVKGHETNTVRIYRQSIRETYACSPVCENTLTIGDNSAKFDALNRQITSRNQLADQASQRQ